MLSSLSNNIFKLIWGQVIDCLWDDVLSWAWTVALLNLFVEIPFGGSKGYSFIFFEKLIIMVWKIIPAWWRNVRFCRNIQIFSLRCCAYSALGFTRMKLVVIYIVLDWTWTFREMKLKSWLNSSHQSKSSCMGEAAHIRFTLDSNIIWAWTRSFIYSRI